MKIWLGRRVHVRDIHARRHLCSVCGLCAPLFIAIARAAVNDDDLGGTAIDPGVCGSLAEKGL